jgi:hypothetical protein
MLGGCQQGKEATNNTEENVDENVEDVTTEETVDPLASLYNFHKTSTYSMKNWKEYMPKASVIGVKDGNYFNLPAKDGYFVMQGGCSDGTYAYLILEGQKMTVNGVYYKAIHKMFKVDMSTWEIVKESEPMNLGHGNSATYNARLGKIIVECYTNVNDIFFVDPETLTITETKTLDYPLTSIAYNYEKDQYVIGNGSYQFSVLDANFQELVYAEGDYIGLGTQDIDCDENYIYVGNSGAASDPGTEVVKVYDWDGEYVGAFRVDFYTEQEALFNVNGKYYITTYTGSGGRLYEIQYDFDWLAE